ncbi:transposable element Tcb1 transposase [Trichonephila clavipes]|nr:transposable element Tcb1 transposase [Trichonephila clavipes]
MSSLSQFEKGRIIGMMEVEWLARLVASQLGRSDCVVRRCWDNSGYERCHLHEDLANFALDRTVIGKTATSSRVERLNPTFALQRHTAPTAGVIVWSVIAYNTRSPLVLIHVPITAQRNIHDILQPHLLPLMQQLPEAISQQDNARLHTARVLTDCLPLVSTLLWSARSPDFSPIEHIWYHLGWRVGHPTRLNKLEANLQQIWNEISQDIIQNLYASMPIVSHRAFALERVQQGIKSSVLLPFL